ncbi:hydrolase [Nocardia yunnanensis]|uniref:Hydrolase n=1 Tax=Nocardia yunnanensis TaxID=2382165 RepID=A0A386ZFL7_9NOCA|nr:hydrolase [Nocardia yunnanensis]AYF75934.1 hydrolase [Nocardia yunnanensis]
MTSTLLDPKTALVLIDLQRGIAAMPTLPHAADEVIARGAQLAKAFRERGLPVVLVRVSFAEDGGDMPPGRTMQPGGRMTPPAGWDELVDELDVQPDDLRITKRQWGAFHGTSLDVQLRRRGVTTIVLGGIATSIGVESTARAAHEHGYHVVVATDAVADRDAASHDHSIEKIFPRLGVTATTDEVLDVLAGLPTED